MLSQEELDRIKRNMKDRPFQKGGGGGKGPMPKPVYRPQDDSHFPKQEFQEHRGEGGKSNMRGDSGRNRRWSALLRLGAFVLSLLGMYISATFSVDGFQFSVDNRAWIGWALAAILVMIESVWQKFGDNYTLFALAFICYTYGVITNVVGIIANRAVIDTVTGISSMTNIPWQTYTIAIVFGVLLEIFPEPVLAWAISGDTSSDPLKKIVAHIEGDIQTLRKFTSES